MRLSLCGILCVLLASSCTKQEAPPVETTPFRGERISVGVPQGIDFETVWDLHLDEWSARTGAEVALAPVAFDSQGAADAPPQLVILPATRLAEWVSGNRLLPIPEGQLAEEALDWRDFFQGVREKFATTADGPAVVPLSAPVLVCYYREDLLRKAGLAPPQTWEDYQQLLESLAEWAPGLTAVEPWGERSRATLFLARSLAFARHPGHYSVFFDIDSGAPLIDGPGFARGLETARRALEKLSPEVKDYDPADCRREILNGTAALAIAYETGPGNPALFGGEAGSAKPAAAPSTNPPPPRTDGLTIACCPLPGASEVYNPTLRAWEPGPEGELNRVTLTGFAGLVAGVSSRSTPPQASAAWNLLGSLTLDETVVFPPGTRGPVRESDLLQAASWTGKELSPRESASYLDAVARSLRDRQLVAELPVIGAGQFRAALGKRLGAALAPGADPQVILTGAAEDWRGIAEKLGTGAVRDSYRRSVGLPALAPAK